jgi:hypothetical protein
MTMATDFQPLVDAAAWWITVQAYRDIAWNVFDVVAGSGVIATLAWVAARVVKWIIADLRREEEKKRKPPSGSAGETS